MAARRLLIVMLVLLGLSTLAAALVPPQARRGGTAGETETTEIEPPSPEGRLPEGRLLSAAIEIGGPRVPVVLVRVGDQLSLLVRSKRPGQVSIPAFGLIETVDPFSPARFDILAEEAGSYPIRLSEVRGAAGRIEVRRSGEPTRPAREERAGGADRDRRERRQR
jgi:hypothetical protein